MSNPRLPDYPISQLPDGDDFILVGRIARAHGNRGQVIVNLDTDFPEERFVVGRVLRVGSGGESRRIGSVRFHQGRPVIGFEGIDTMDAAEALAGAELKMPASEMQPLPVDTFYHHDLVGCEVKTRRGDEVGRVIAVEGPMERSHLVVASPKGDVMIPLVATICVSVNPAARTIVVDPPEGLLDLN
jgi:16S rRNA processing protein RimM